MNRTIISLAFTLSFPLIVTAQPPKTVLQYFDAHWKSVSKPKAVYLLRILPVKDSCWEYDYYNVIGPLVRVCTYLDRTATIRQGFCAWYNEDGKLDSAGYYDHNQPDGEWIAVDRDGRTGNSRFFDKGRLMSEKEAQQKLQDGSVPDPKFPDLTRVSPESYFPGGEEAWDGYLAANLEFPQRALAYHVRGTVITEFEVDPYGKVRHVRIFQSVEISLDDEAIWIMQNSPSWIPAIRYDRKVRSIKRQPVAFSVPISGGR